jgi:hypothetical protein
MVRGRLAATDVGAALPFTGPTPGLATPNMTCSSTPLQLPMLFFTNLLCCYLLKKPTGIALSITILKEPG